MLKTFFNIVKHQLIRRSFFAYREQFYPSEQSNQEFIQQFSFSKHDSSDFLKKFEEHGRFNFFFNPTNRKAFFLQLLAGHHSETDIIMEAESVARGNISFLGTSHQFESNWNWHTDFKTHHLFDPEIFYTNISIPSNGSDIKLPWELSRFGVVWSLGKAYWMTNRSEYKKFFINLVSDWKEKNTFCRGVNWFNAMEVAIRASNLIAGYYFFFESTQPKTLDSFDFSEDISASEEEPTFWLSFLRLIYQHGKYISNNLEYTRRSGNHLIADALGLLIIGIFFKHSAVGKTWIQEAKLILEEEIFMQTYSDGVNYEMSIAYHFFVSEMFFIAMLLMDRNKMPFENGYKARLEKMLTFIVHYSKPNGTAPLIGDSDDGRFFNFNPNNYAHHHLDLLAAASIYYRRSDFKTKASTFSESALWLLGVEGFEHFQKLAPSSTKKDSKLFRTSGFATMENDTAHIVIDCGELGKKGWGGHGHNDTFSFELFANGSNFITDSGTYCYTSDIILRNRFRGTRAHNSLMIDDTELAEFDGSFKIKKDLTRPVINTWKSNEKEDLLEAEQFAYRSLPEPVSHKRRFHFEKIQNFFELTDVLSAIGEHLAEWNFHFAPGVSLEQTTPNSILAISEEGARLSIHFNAEGKDLILTDDLHSPRYGVSEKSKVLRLKQRFRRELKFSIRFSF